MITTVTGPRARGLPVDVATCEAREPAAQSWHWVDPVVGAVKAARVLRPAAAWWSSGTSTSRRPRWPSRSRPPAAGRRPSDEEWLELLPTTGGLTRLRSDQLSAVLGAVGHAVNAPGGRFTMHCTTLATTAVRTGTG